MQDGSDFMCQRVDITVFLVPFVHSLCRDCFSHCWNMVQKWSCVRRILSACENTPRKRESWDFSLFKRQNSVFLPGVVERSEFTSAAVIRMLLWEIVFLLCTACLDDCVLYSRDLC